MRYWSCTRNVTQETARYFLSGRTSSSFGSGGSEGESYLRGELKRPRVALLGFLGNMGKERIFRQSGCVTKGFAQRKTGRSWEKEKRVVRGTTI